MRAKTLAIARVGRSPREGPPRGRGIGSHTSSSAGKRSSRWMRSNASGFLGSGQRRSPWGSQWLLVASPQFLMENHDQEELDLQTGLYPKRTAVRSDDTSEEDFLEEKEGREEVTG
ncbi:unnamed protein product [Eretmochelys imbricata]